MSHICTYTFLVLPYFRRTFETVRRDQPPPFPRGVVELCSSFVIQGYANDTCIICSVKLPFREAVLQPAPVSAGKMLPARAQVRQIQVHSLLSSPSWQVSLLPRALKSFRGARVALLRGAWEA